MNIYDQPTELSVEEINAITGGVTDTGTGFDINETAGGSGIQFSGPGTGTAHYEIIGGRP